MEKETENKTAFDKIGIGTKEIKPLSEKDVIVMGHRQDLIMDKANPQKKVGDKIVLIVKHPDREDNIELSQVKYLKNEKVSSSGLWFNLDEDELIVKKSALADTMRKYECNLIEDFVGKTLSTMLDGNYLVVKAY